MFEFFKKKPDPQVEEKNPIPLPEIAADKMNPVAIAEMIKNDTAIWGWYKVTDLKNNNINVTAMLNMTYGFDGLALFRKEGDFLVKYRVDVVGEELKIYTKLADVCKLTNSNIMELFNTELSDAYKLFYDENSEYSAGCQSYVHDVNEDMLNDYLSTHRVFHVGEEHFFAKKDYPNGLPTDEEE